MTRFIFLMLSLLLVSCSPSGRNQSVAFYQANPAALFDHAFAQARRLGSFEGSGNLSVESPQGGFSGSARVYYQRPDSLLVQVKASLGVSVGYMLILGQQFWLYNIPDNILWQSAGREVPLQPLIGVDLDVPNIMDAALGLPGIEPQRALRTPEPDSFQIDFVGDNIRYRFRVGSESHIYIADPEREAFIAYSLVRNDDADTLFYDFRQFQRYDGINIPRHIQITRPAGRERISFFYTRITANGRHRDGRFKLRVSDNADVIELDR